MKDYFIYLPYRQEENPWGCTCISTGYQRVRVGSPYPPAQHPLDHHFSWSEGRILHTYTIVYITEGSGFFESAPLMRRIRVRAGTVFVLFPGEWHRYAPDPLTGWVENWIECSGPAFDLAMTLGIINPKKPVFRIGLDPNLILAFDHCHSLAQRNAPAHQAALSTLGLHILALLEQAGQSSNRIHRETNNMIGRAHMLITERFDQPLKMRELVRELKVGYSQFRQIFKKNTGMTLKQYHLQVRMQKAQNLLTNTSKTVKEISELLGFTSPYHLSKQFKTLTGFAPMHWRARLHHPAPGRDAARRPGVLTGD